MTVSLSERQVAKREKIAKAARRLFLKEGYAGTSMDAVAAAAGVSKQTLYTYFPAKLDLLRTILEEEIASIGTPDPAMPQLETVDDLRALLVGFSARLSGMLLHADTVAVIRLILGEAFRMPELRETLRSALPVRALQRFAALIAHAAELGIIDAPDPDLAARMLLGPIMTYVAIDGFLTTGHVTPPSPEKLERIVDYFLSMVVVKP